MWFFYLTLLTTFFVPGVLFPGVGRVWAADALLGIFIVGRLIFPPQESAEYVRLYNRCLLWPYAVIVIWITVVTIVAVMINGFGGLPPEFIAVSTLGRARLLLYLFLIRPFLATPARASKALTFLFILFWLEFLVLVSQKYNLLGVNQWYTPRFRVEDVEDIAYFYLLGGRSIGTIGNPNAVGTFLSMVGPLGLAQHLFASSRIPRLMGLAVFLASLFACIFLAETRQGTFCTLAGGAIACGFAFALGYLGRLTFVTILAIFSVPVFASMLLADPRLAERFAALLGAKSLLREESLTFRFMIWPEFFDKYGASAFVGQGMGALILSEVWDSGWLTILQLGGLPLLLLYLWWLLRTPVEGLRSVAAGYRVPQTTAFAVASVTTAAVLLVTETVNSTLNYTLLLVVLALQYGLALAWIYFQSQASTHPLALHQSR